MGQKLHVKALRALRGPKLAEIDTSRIVDFIEALQGSTIPFLVEARDWACLPASFHREIEREHVVLVEREERAVAGEWRTALWGELATLEYGKSLRGYDSSEGPHRVYGTNGPIGWHSETLCSHPSVIIGRKGAYRGVHYSASPFFVIDPAFYLKPNAEIDNPVGILRTTDTRHQWHG